MSVANFKSINSEIIPFETEESLASSNAMNIDQSSEIVHYRVMRNFAIQELASTFYYLLGLGNHFSVSEFPVIIYDYDSKPSFYEFIVFENGSAVATITMYVHKRTDDLVAYVLPFVRDYTQYNITDDFVIGRYPNNPYIATINTYGELLTNLYDKENETVVEALPVDDLQKLNELYNVLPDSDKVEIGNGKQEIANEIIQERIDGANFWNAEYTNFESLINESDQAILTRIIDGKTNAVIYKTPHYYNINLWKTRWKSACGPAVTAWIYRGLYTHYKNAYVKIHGDPKGNTANFNASTNFSYWTYYTASSAETLKNEMGNQDGGLLYDIYNKGNTLWNGLLAGMTWPQGMNKALKYVTSYNYKYVYTSNIYLHIKNKHLPAYRVIGSGGGNLHYIFEFATFKIGTNNKFFLVSDNGATTYSYNYMPYWRNKHTAAWGLRYGVKLY